MTEFSPPAPRALSESERQAFQALGLTPGHWAALAPAPLFYHAELRTPNRRTRGDLNVAEELRLTLRTMEGLSAEAGHFWERLGDGSRRSEALLATRLLAWHLATDRTFRQRDAFGRLLRRAAGHFSVHGPRNPPRYEAVETFRWSIDSYLPHHTFLLTGNPPLIRVVPPGAGALDALAGMIESPFLPPWPTTHPRDVPRALSTLTHLLGEPISEWWEKPDPARRAVERGLASFSFADRERLYGTIRGEWARALHDSYGWPNADDFARAFVARMREWVDAVRWAARGPLAARLAAAVVEFGADEPDLVTAGRPVARPVAPEERSDRAALSAPAEPLPPEIHRVPPLREAAPKPAPPKTPPKPKPERVSVKTATGFEPVPFEATLARARAVPVADVCAWVDKNVPLLFDDCRDESSRAIAVVRTEPAMPKALWIVGDLHADVLALANILALAESQATAERPAHFLFLGDFVDRGIHDHEALLLLFELLMKHPDRVCVVPGNHDIDLVFDETENRFRVTIEPAEYCENLNAALKGDTQEDRQRVALAKAFIRFCAARPKAVFLPDGTLFTHGGFPHTDAQKDIASLPDLCKPKCIDDFLWARIAESARVKRPNRGSRGHEFGWDTLAQFAKLAAEKLDIPVKRLVRGHDHVTDRWMEYPEYADNGVPVLTVNAMGRLLDGEPARRDGRTHPLPVVARHVPNHLPEVFILPLDPAEVDRAFNRTRSPRSPELERALEGIGLPLPTDEAGTDVREPGAEGGS